jgi:hypothetical protein
MSAQKPLLIFLSLFFLLQEIFCPWLQGAGQGFCSGRGQARGEGRRVHGEKCTKSLPNPIYRENCGACHLAYPPKLLPASSWKKIINRSADHFGEPLVINTKNKEIISRYLIENSADRSSCKRALKIVKSLQGESPVRITEIPYIRDKHRKIPLKTLERKNIGSLSNCLACHKKADQDVFNKRDIKIPS